MKKLEVQEYLESHSLIDLEREHAIHARASAGGSKFSLNYDQFHARPSRVVDQCRGQYSVELTRAHLSVTSIGSDVSSGPPGC